MHYPAVTNRVRMHGRDDEFIVIRVDHFAFVADLRTMVGEIVEENVPFHLLECDGTASLFVLDEHTLATARAVLDSSHLRLRESQATVAELMDLISDTVDAIRSSQRLIASSDHIVPLNGGMEEGWMEEQKV